LEIYEMASASYGYPLSDSETKDWRVLYQEALFEIDMEKLPARVELATKAVETRMRQLAESRDLTDRDDLMDALQTLRALRLGRP
jgi:hypothetical protein